MWKTMWKMCITFCIGFYELRYVIRSPLILTGNGKIFPAQALDRAGAECYNVSAQRSRYGSPSSPQASAEGSTGTTLRRFSGVVLL